MIQPPRSHPSQLTHTRATRRARALISVNCWIRAMATRMLRTERATANCTRSWHPGTYRVGVISGHSYRGTLASMERMQRVQSMLSRNTTQSHHCSPIRTRNVSRKTDLANWKYGRRGSEDICSNKQAKMLWHIFAVIHFYRQHNSRFRIGGLFDLYDIVM